MVHPTELLRSNSIAVREFVAPLNVVDKNELDCGLTNLPILNRFCNLERYAQPKVFLFFLSLVGLIQGITLTYFRDTSIIWGKHYNIAQENIEWLIYTNEFIVGIFALLVSYYGNKIHRISWIGGLTVFQAIASATLIVPEIYRRGDGSSGYTNITDLLCHEKTPTIEEIEVNYIAFAVILIFETFFAITSVSFISHGITYLDDNTLTKNSPSYIGIALACRELGKQAGLYFSWIPIFLKIEGVFLSPMWLVITTMIFISGVFIAMFPRSLPSILMKNFSASLVDIASGHVTAKKEVVDGLFKTLWRLLKNKVLIVNIVCVACLQAGIINFNIFEKHFNQASFQISHINDYSVTQFATNILKQPLVALVIITTGFVVARTSAELKSLIKWNMVVLVFVIVTFASTAFLKCKLSTTFEEMVQTEACARTCRCSFEVFSPVCLQSKTYYSPCLAGCPQVTEVDSIKSFFSCKCNTMAIGKEGPCKFAECEFFYALSQVNRILTTALLASTLVTNLIINMRCVLIRDKATALGLDATFSSLIPYLPVKLIYGVIASKVGYKKINDGNCKLYSRGLTMFLTGSTIGWMVVSLILSVILFLLLKFSPPQQQDDDDTELREMRRSSLAANRSSIDGVAPTESRMLSLQNSTETIPNSLLEMENVGDDHDSVDFDYDARREEMNKRRLLESNL